MSAGSCEGFEIAIEMRLHGVPAPDRDAELERHLAHCESCRTYEAEARGVDEALRSGLPKGGSVNWAVLRKRVLFRRYRGFGWRLAVAAALVWNFTAGLLDRIARSSSAYPSRDYLPFELFLAVVAAGWIVWQGWARAREARDAASPRYLEILYHEDLLRRMRRIRRWWWVWSLYVLLNLMAVPSSGPASSLARVLVLALLLPAIWSRFVVLPRLEREEQDLPFFDEYPHIT